MSGYRLFRDGSAWCAVPPHFVDLMTSPAGFGNTKEAAVAALLADRGYQTQQRRITAPAAKLEAFVEGGFCRRCKEWIDADGEPDGCRDPDCPWLTGRDHVEGDTLPSEMTP